MTKVAFSDEHLTYAACSDIGMKRAINQDSFDAQFSAIDEWSKRGHRFLVADGMGAHAAGELASQLAAEQVMEQYQRSDAEPRQAICDALELANKHIFDRGQADPQLFNMGTTCSSLILLPAGALVGHVGDSRVYRCRDELLQQLTFDHSLVWEMRAAGQLGSNGESANIPRNVITRCLGPHSDVDIDVEGFFSVRKGDTFLLCSDGLTGKVTDQEIGGIVRYLNPEVAVDFLVDLANLRGGSDNITVIVARVVSDKLSAAGEVPEKIPRAATGTHPAWWILAGVGLVAALLGIRFEQVPVIAIGGIAFCLGALGAALQWFRQRRHPQPTPNAIPTSPYVTAPAVVDDTFFHGIKSTLEAMGTAFPELPITPALESLQSVPKTDVGGFSNESCIQICEQFAELAKQLRDKI